MSQGTKAILSSAAQRPVSLGGTESEGLGTQLRADSETQVIVAAEATQQVLDRGRMLTKTAEHNFGKPPDVVTADAGYWNTEIVKEAIQSGVHVLVPPDGATALKIVNRVWPTILWRSACARISPPITDARCIACDKPSLNQ